MKSTKDIISTTRNYMTTCLCGGKTATVMFKAYAKTLGRIMIEAKVESLPKNTCPISFKFDNNSYVDVVRKKLLVEVHFSFNLLLKLLIICYIYYMFIHYISR